MADPLTDVLQLVQADHCVDKLLDGLAKLNVEVHVSLVVLHRRIAQMYVDKLATREDFLREAAEHWDAAKARQAS